LPPQPIGLRLARRIGHRLSSGETISIADQFLILGEVASENLEVAPAQNLALNFSLDCLATTG
jgi:hypothetical protein